MVENVMRKKFEDSEISNAASSGRRGGVVFHHRGRLTLRCLAFLLTTLILMLPAPASGKSGAEAARQAPTLKQNGAAVQLIVDEAPFLVLGGELHNSTTSSLAYMESHWDTLTALHLNTVLASVTWELLEPQEGTFDFSLVDGLIEQARAHRMRLILLWFGTWKNGLSTYAPAWVKTDAKRFTRARNRSGATLDVISPFCEAARNADARAFQALMRHIRELDGAHQTVLMTQVENEVGLLGDSRDHSVPAKSAWGGEVPAVLMSYLASHESKLQPEVRETWRSAGGKGSGTWREVFGTSPAADEIFMAWHIARYVGEVASAGKHEYAIPMFANAWLRTEFELPGSYPSGGPEAHMFDIWRAAAPSLDFFAPDIYASDFRGICRTYASSGNPLFIPEALRDPDAAGRAFYAVGKHSAIGFSPFGIDSAGGDHPLKDSYETLAQLAPLIARHQGTGSIAGFWEAEQAGETVILGDYQLQVSYPTGGQNRRKGFGIVIATGPDEFILAGAGLKVVFSPRLAGGTTVRILTMDEGVFEGTSWVPGRRLNGDESGHGMRVSLPQGKPTITKVKLFRFE